MLKNPHPGTLTVGHKKEIVISHEQAATKPNLSFIGFFLGVDHTMQGGWGCPHGPGFVDYAQGTRLVHPIMTVNGKEMEYEKVLQHPDYYRLVIDCETVNRDSGPFKVTRYPTNPQKWDAGL
jgi:hypothetical protein